jgi:hypothetical protein
MVPCVLRMDFNGSRPDTVCALKIRYAPQAVLAKLKLSEPGD